MKKACLVVFSISIIFLLQSQAQLRAQLTIDRYQDTLIQLQKDLYSSKEEYKRSAISGKMISILRNALTLEESFNYGFDSLKEIGHLASADHFFNLFTWDVRHTDGTYDYYGLIQLKSINHQPCKVYTLVDKSSEVRNPETMVGDPSKWFGMVYYKIIPFKFHRKKYYALLGWDGNDKLTSKKIIDVVTFQSRDNLPKFGADVFVLERKTVKRVIFEYGAQAVMSLKYEEENKRIVFDHLSPSQPKFEGQFQYYGPDFSFDCLKLKEGKWQYQADIDARNKVSGNEGKYNNPKEKKAYDNKQFYQTH